LKERDRLINEIEELQKKVQTQTKYIEQLEEKNSENEEKIKDLYRQLEDLSNEAFKGKRAFEQVSSKLQETSDEKQFLADELKKFKQQVLKIFIFLARFLEFFWGSFINFVTIKKITFSLKFNFPSFFSMNQSTALWFSRTCKCSVFVPI
jgi:predicted RNase H-like nuclease (RuvC/YqgF family)